MSEEVQQEVQQEAPAETQQENQPVKFDEAQQAKINDIVGKHVGKTHAERRRAEAAEAKIKELEAQIPKAERPTVPNPPDPYSENYQQEMEAYTRAVREAEAFDARQAVNSEIQLQQQQQAQIKQHEYQQKRAQDFMAQGETLGHSQEDLINAGVALDNAGLNDTIGQALMDDPNGPDIVMYLSKNPLALNDVLNMQPHMALLHIAREIEPKCKKSVKKDDLPPDPPNHLSGRGGIAEGERGPKGAKFW